MLQYQHMCMPWDRGTYSSLASRSKMPGGSAVRALLESRRNLYAREAHCHCTIPYLNRHTRHVAIMHFHLYGFTKFQCSIRVEHL